MYTHTHMHLYMYKITLEECIRNLICLQGELAGKEIKTEGNIFPVHFLLFTFECL